MKKIVILFLLIFMSCSTDNSENEKLGFECPDGLTLPTNVVGDIDNLFQGDILIDRNQTKQVGVTNALWDNKILNIHLDERFNDDQIDIIVKGLVEYVDLGFTINFITKEQAFELNPIDHIFIKYSGIAASHIGKKGGQQEMYLPHSWMKVETVIHEVGHVIGLHHPHVTDMRDVWLTIYWDNIREDKKSFFNTYKEYDNSYTGQKEGFEYGDEYDIYSAMGYSSNSFAIDPMNPTMTLKDGTWFKGGDKLSTGDKISIIRMYECYEQNKKE